MNMSPLAGLRMWQMACFYKHVAPNGALKM